MGKKTKRAIWPPKGYTIVAIGANGAHWLATKLSSDWCGQITGSYRNALRQARANSKRR